MCFYIHPEHRKVKIAKKDILCYKILERIPKSLDEDYYPISFYKNKFFPMYYRSKLVYDFSEQKVYSIKSFSFKKDFKDIKIEIFRGFHSYISRERAREVNKWDSPLNRIVQFVIPKGTKYYYNPDKKEYVSLKIKFVKVTS